MVFFETPGHLQGARQEDLLSRSRNPTINTYSNKERTLSIVSTVKTKTVMTRAGKLPKG